MKKSIFFILIFVSYIGFCCTVTTSNSTALQKNLQGNSKENTKKNTKKNTMKNNLELSKNLKVVIYTQIDKGRANAGSDKLIGSDGKVYHMGKADYQPFIKKCETILNEKQSEEFLNSELVFLPYFREIKPTITLKTYFETIQDSALSANLFPQNLEGYYSYPKEKRMFFATLLSNELYPTNTIQVIYANETTYYIEGIYYRMEMDLPNEVYKNNCDDNFEEGDLMNFIRTSDLVQSKIEEGK